MASMLGDMVVRIVGDTADFVRKIDQSGQKLKGFEKDLKKLTDTMSKLGKRMTMFVTLPIVGAAAASIKAAADFEKQRVAFETLLGSAEKAKPLLAEIERFAAATPFQLPDLLTGAKRLIGFGIASNQVVDTMRRLGNAAMGDEAILQRLVLAFGKVQAKGKASMEELNMFAEAGVPILDALAKNYGVTKAEMLKLVTLGKVGFEDVNKALTSLTTGSGQFAGMIEKQSQTLSGLISTMKDNTILLGKSFGDILLPAIKRNVSSFTAFVQRFQEMDERQKKIIMTILGIVAAIGPALVIIAKLIKVIQALRTAFIFLNAVMIANPIVAIIAGVALLATGIVALVGHLKNQKKAQEEVTIATDDERLAILRNNAAKVQMTLESVRVAKAKLQEALAITKDTEAKKRLQKEIDALTIRETALMKAVGLADRYVTNFKKTTDDTADVLGEAGDAAGDAAKKFEILDTELQEFIKDQITIVAGFPIMSRELLGLTDMYSGFYDMMAAREPEVLEYYEDVAAAIAKEVADKKAAWDEEVLLRQIVENELYEAGKRRREKEEEEEKQNQTKMKVIRAAALDTFSDVFGSMATISNNYYAGLLDNEELTDKERKKILRDQAKKQRSFNLFQAIINTARAIAQALPNIPLSILAGIMGAAQIAAIRSTPLPKLARGGKLERPTIVMGGEAGPEWMVPELKLDELGGKIAAAMQNAQITNVINNNQPIQLGIYLDGRQIDAHITKSISNRQIIVAKESVA